ncbi:hypothetical protein H2200_007072 [Cladophialophora chaetospira]|uniref:Uncharacterized protein n=1 Tax=Cladophialophora chaetospira TaxID=386627 RepID=A0AA39CH43_9EURO|nr:hypothetical protein H2200_007072 [Cladophialophora chaetospira]
MESAYNIPKRALSPTLSEETSHHKRKRVGDGLPRRLSQLESLPCELLEQIFLNCCNGNLLLAAPIVAAKLSGRRSLYAVCYIASFYSNQAGEILYYYGLSDLASMIPSTFSSWELRSMTKAVLRSRWCTFGFAESFLIDLPSVAIDACLDFLDYGGSLAGHRQQELDLLERLQVSQEKYRVQRQVLTGPWFSISASHFETSIDYLARVDRNNDADVQVIHLFGWYDSRVVLHHFDWLFCGTGFMESPCNGSVLPTTPFRQLVENGIRQSLNNRIWANDTRLYPHNDWAPADSSSSLSPTAVALDFYFHPENQPFKLNPVLFCLTAAAEIQRYFGDPDIQFSRTWRGFHFLFGVDPTSLPRTDPVIISYARFLLRRVVNIEQNLTRFRHDLRHIQREGALTPLSHRVARQNFKRLRGLQNKDYQILEYITTGKIYGFTPDHVSPYLGPGIDDDCCGPVADVAYIARESEGDLPEMQHNTRQRLGEHPVIRAYRSSSIYSCRKDPCIAAAVLAYTEPEYQPEYDDIWHGYSVPPLSMNVWNYDHRHRAIAIDISDPDHERYMDAEDIRWDKEAVLDDTKPPYPKYVPPDWYDRSTLDELPSGAFGYLAALNPDRDDVGGTVQIIGS